MSPFSDDLARVFKKPEWPTTIDERPASVKLGIEYDTAWARTPAVRASRALITDGLTRPLTRLVTTPTIYGAESLDDIDGPVIFAPNHSSHLDTAVIISCLPSSFRHHTVVAAAADYFFDRHWKAALWAFLLSTIPVDRQRINRKSADVAAELINDGWSLIIYPEGGRTHDGWGQEFTPASAAYIAKRCGVPVIPVHLKGVRPVFARGSSKLSPGKVEVRFGKAMRPLGPTEGRTRDEDARRFSRRIEDAVAVLADEAETDWYSARLRASQGETPAFRGPEMAEWRRTWGLAPSQRAHQGRSGKRSIPW